MFVGVKEYKVGIFLMLASSICVCFGQLFWKIADMNLFLLALGFALYGIGALFMIIAYRFGPLSVLQPVLSLNYVLSIAIAALILKEPVTILKCVGVIVIILGVLFVALGEDR